jgi:hypothetical protein
VNRVQKQSNVPRGTFNEEIRPENNLSKQNSSRDNPGASVIMRWSRGRIQKPCPVFLQEHSSKLTGISMNLPVQNFLREPMPGFFFHSISSPRQSGTHSSNFG